MTWHGYAIWSITTPLTDDTVDEDGIVTEIGTKNLARNAVLELGKQSGPAHKVTHIRQSLDGQEILIELELTTKVTKAQAVNKLAEHLPYTATQISNNSSLTIFEGNNWSERRKNTVEYLINNKEDWE